MKRKRGHIMDEKEYTSVINKKDKNRDDFER